MQGRFACDGTPKQTLWFSSASGVEWSLRVRWQDVSALTMPGDWAGAAGMKLLERLEVE